jgi:hypothetical protein
MLQKLTVFCVFCGTILLAGLLGSAPATAQSWEDGLRVSCGPPGGRQRPGCDEYGRRYAPPPGWGYRDSRRPPGHYYGPPVGGAGPSCGPPGGRRRPGCDRYGNRYAY